MQTGFTKKEFGRSRNLRSSDTWAKGNRDNSDLQWLELLTHAFCPVPSSSNHLSSLLLFERLYSFPTESASSYPLIHLLPAPRPRYKAPSYAAPGQNSSQAASDWLSVGHSPSFGLNHFRQRMQQYNWSCIHPRQCKAECHERKAYKITLTGGRENKFAKEGRTTSCPPQIIIIDVKVNINYMA